MAVDSETKNSNGSTIIEGLSVISISVFKKDNLTSCLGELGIPFFFESCLQFLGIYRESCSTLFNETIKTSPNKPKNCFKLLKTYMKSLDTKLL